jgi:hypothetical protein
VFILNLMKTEKLLQKLSHKKRGAYRHTDVITQYTTRIVQALQESLSKIMFLFCKKLCNHPSK